jgi:hypothetical protein
MPMNTLLYASYGEGPHLDELTYALLSTSQLIGSDPDCRIVVYTDNPERFGGMRVHAERVTPETLAAWGGPLGFGHRRKICALKDALGKFGGRLLYCDADTFFIGQPRKVFARIRPGHTLMHVAEYRLSHFQAAPLAEFLAAHNVYDLLNRRWETSPMTVIFNAGVIGLHEADIALLDEVIHLTDALFPRVRVHNVEQFAFGLVLQQRSRLRQSYDLIHHYWWPDRRTPFNEQLRRVLHDSTIQSDQERLERLSPYRPSLRFKDRPFKYFVKNRLTAQTHDLIWSLASQTGLLSSMKKLAQRVRLY